MIFLLMSCGDDMCGLWKRVDVYPHLFKILTHHVLKFIKVWLSPHFWLELRIWRAPESTVTCHVFWTLRALGMALMSSTHLLPSMASHSCQKASTAREKAPGSRVCGLACVLWLDPPALPFGPRCRKLAQKAALVDLFLLWITSFTHCCDCLHLRVAIHEREDSFFVTLDSPQS